MTTAPCACTTVRKANRALTRFYELAMQGSGVSITQFSILRALNRNGPTPLSALADELVMERSSLYRTIAPLQADGAVAIAPAGSGRAKTAALTPIGEAMMTRATPFWERAQSAFLAEISPDAWSRLAEVLLAIPVALETRA